MTNEDTALEAPVETVEITNNEEPPSPSEENTVPPKNDEPVKGVEDDPSKEVEPETPEQELERLRSENKQLESAQKKISAQRKAYASLQKAAEEKDAKLKEFIAQQQSTESAQAPKKPDVNDFDSYDEYEKATASYVDELAEFKAKEQVNKERQVAMQLEAQQARLKAQAERSAQYESQKKAFMAENPQYVEAEANFNEYVQQVEQITDPRVQNAVVNQAYNHSEVPAPVLINYFGANYGENIAELDQISKLSPEAAAVEIYKIQEKLKSNPKPSAKKEPLPKPIAKPKGGGGKTKSLNDMSADELLKWAKS